VAGEIFVTNGSLTNTTSSQFWSRVGHAEDVPGTPALRPEGHDRTTARRTASDVGDQLCVRRHSCNLRSRIFWISGKALKSPRRPEQGRAGGRPVGYSSRALRSGCESAARKCWPSRGIRTLGEVIYVTIPCKNRRAGKCPEFPVSVVV